MGGYCVLCFGFGFGLNLGGFGFGVGVLEVVLGFVTWVGLS